MTREEVQDILIKDLENYIKDFGEDKIFCMAPQRGKSSWTAKEMLDAVKQDTIPEGYGSNPIDDFINYLNYKDEHGL